MKDNTFLKITCAMVLCSLLYIMFASCDSGETDLQYWCRNMDSSNKYIRMGNDVAKLEIQELITIHKQYDVGNFQYPTFKADSIERIKDSMYSIGYTFRESAYARYQPNNK